MVFSSPDFCLGVLTFNQKTQKHGVRHIWTMKHICWGELCYERATKEGKCSFWECPFVFSNFPNHLSVLGFNILEDDMNI